MKTGKYQTAAICLIVAGVLAFVGGCSRPEGPISMQANITGLVPLKEKASAKLTVLPFGRKSNAKANSHQQKAEKLLADQLTKRLADVPGVEVVPYATARKRLPKDQKNTRDKLTKAMGLDLVVYGEMKKFSRLADEKGPIELDLIWEIEFVDSSGRKQAAGGAILHAEGGYKLEALCEMSVQAVIEELKDRRRPSSAKTEIIVQ